MNLSKEARELLEKIIPFGDKWVSADEIPACAELIAAGLIRAEDDCEGPRLFLTDAAKELPAVRRVNT